MAVVAWLAPSLCTTIVNNTDKLEVLMQVNAKVILKVQGNVGVGVGPGLVKHRATQTTACTEAAELLVQNRA